VNNVLKGYDGQIFKPVSELEQEGPVFDLCVANILAPILIHLAPTLASHIKVGGKIALSGLVTPQADTVIKCYEQYFRDVKLEEEEDGWSLITGIKR
jgi:ribosomal protein L11 methyltransferase